jgi:predicted transcriptional regulator
VYTDTKEGASIVEAKNGDYILIKDDGGWIRVSPDGSLSSVSESGDWSVIKTNGDTIAVDENGEATITNVVTGEYSQDYKSLELPKPPAPVDGYSTAPKEGVKPTSAKTHG